MSLGIVLISTEFAVQHWPAEENLTESVTKKCPPIWENREKPEAEAETETDCSSQFLMEMEMKTEKQQKNKIK